MTDADLQNIQDELNIKIPQSYWDIMTNFPNPEFAEAELWGLYTDPQKVLKDTQCHRERGWFWIDWPAHYLVIGETGCGDTYFMLAEQNAPVYLANHEGGPHPIDDLDGCIVAQTIEEHLKYSIEMEIESIEEDRLRAERKKNKKWWEFWI